ncbi:MAG: Crp/Fnr family transcriptional regulator [Methyloligellaceae bacterium]
MWTETLSSVRFFEALPNEARARLERQCTWRVFRPREQIIGHQEHSDEVYFVITGAVRAIIYSVSGKAVAYRDVGQGEMFGELSAIDGEPRSASIEALKESLVASMPAALFWSTLANEPAFTRAVLLHLVQQMRALTGRVFEFSTLAVNNRIHAELLRLAQAGRLNGASAVIEDFPTHAELASRISTHREAVTRELNRLAEHGLISRKGSSLHIADVQRLGRLVEDVTGDSLLD